MSIRIVIGRDFDALSESAASLVMERIAAGVAARGRFVLGLATGNSPTGIYKHLAKGAGAGRFDPSAVSTFNLDEYVGLPGDNAQDRATHHESYSYFMIQELFGLMARKFRSTRVPPGTLIDQAALSAELAAHPGDWREAGTGMGRSIVISGTAGGYLGWVRDAVLGSYERQIRAAGGIDLQVIGVGGKGHVAFHEAGIDFAGSRMLLVRLDDNTVENAVRDGHFASVSDCPLYAVSMGAELVFEAGTVVLVAEGARKVEPVARALLGDVSPDVPLSYCQEYGRRGGDLVCFVDRVVGGELLRNRAPLAARGVVIEDRSDIPAAVSAGEILFSRDPGTGRLR